MEKLDNFINGKLNSGIIETKDIPDIVLYLVNLLEDKRSLKIRVSSEEMYKLLEAYRYYIITKIICEFNTHEFITIYNVCAQLVIKQLKIIKTPSAFCLLK